MTNVPTTTEARRKAIEYLGRSQEVDADIASAALYETKMYEFVAASIDRSRAAGALVLTASSAIAVIYSGILGLIFSTDSTALPVRGLVAPLFLGLAVVFSVFNAAYASTHRRQ